MDKIKVIRIVIKIIAILLIIQSIKNVINDWDYINELSKTLVILLLIANTVVLIVSSMKKNINMKFIIILACYIICTLFIPVYTKKETIFDWYWDESYVYTDKSIYGFEIEEE